MTRQPPSSYERICECPCPAHDGRHRLACNDSGCRRRIICASQPTTLLAPHPALFLSYNGDLWSVPWLASDRFE